MTRLPRIFAAALALSVAAIGLTPSNVAAVTASRVSISAPSLTCCDALSRPVSSLRVSTTASRDWRRPALATSASQQQASTATTLVLWASTEGTTPQFPSAAGPSLPAPAAANRATGLSPVAEVETAPVKSARSVSSDVGGLDLRPRRRIPRTGPRLQTGHLDGHRAAFAGCSYRSPALHLSVQATPDNSAHRSGVSSTRARPVLHQARNPSSQGETA